MSGRSAVFNLLSTDPILTSAYGIDRGRVWPAHAVDTVPRKGPFLILRWEERERGRNMASDITVLTIWAHQARESSTDFATLDLILDRVEELLLGVEHLSGTDGTITQIDHNGRSPDLNDEGYKTITRNSAFRVLSR
jgi:hypothetical protein